VEEKRMLEPQQPKTIIVNNTTIINKTINITKNITVNNIVINEGPRPEAIAQASGHEVKVVAANTLRAHQEAPAIAVRENHLPTKIMVQSPVKEQIPESVRNAEPIARAVEPMLEKLNHVEPKVIPSYEKPVAGEAYARAPNEPREPEAKPVAQPDKNAFRAAPNEAAKPWPKPGLKTEPKTEPGMEPKSQPRSEPKAEVRTEPKPQPPVESKSEPKAPPKTEPKTGTKAEPKPGAKPPIAPGNATKKPGQPEPAPRQKPAPAKKTKTDEKPGSPPETPTKPQP
jgi:hypothetical protein